MKKCLIGGEWRETSEKFEVVNPYDGEVISQVCSVNENECRAVISHADKAANEMKKLPRYKIAKSLRKISDGTTAVEYQIYSNPQLAPSKYLNGYLVGSVFLTLQNLARVSQEDKYRNADSVELK